MRLRQTAAALLLVVFVLSACADARLASHSAAAGRTQESARSAPTAPTAPTALTALISIVPQPEPPTPVVATLHWFHEPIYSSPGGAPSGLYLRRSSGPFPVLGRSRDSEWLALRVDWLEPPIVWLSSARAQLDLPLEQLPIMVGPSLEVVTADGSDAWQWVGEALTWSHGDYSEWLWSPTGQLLFESRAGAWRWNPLNGERIPVHWAAVGRVSPDGRWSTRADWAVYPELSAVEIVSLETGARHRFAGVHRHLRTHQPPEAFPPRWQPDSSAVVTWAQAVSAEEPTRVYELSTDGSIRELADIPPRTTELPPRNWSPDGRYRLDQANGALSVWDAVDEVSRLVSTAARLNASDPYLLSGWWWSPDSNRVAVSLRGAGAWLIEASSGAARPLLEANARAICGVDWVWSPDGMRLAAAVQIDAGADGVDANGVAALPALGAGYGPASGWELSEIRVYRSDGRLQDVYCTLAGRTGGEMRAAWSPDSRWLAIGPNAAPECN